MITQQGQEIIRWLRAHCYLCLKNMEEPGEYRALNGRKVSCWHCWESLPLCGQCGRGSKIQYCRDCLALKRK